MPDVNRIIFERLVVDGPFGISDGPITMFPVPVNHVNNLHRGFNRFDFVAFVTHFGRNCCECICHDGQYYGPVSRPGFYFVQRMMSTKW